MDSYASGEPNGISDAELPKGREELVKFAERTLHRLVVAEQKAYQHKPSISLFCRMDIGIMANKKAELGYFVNEITRGPTPPSLWSSIHERTANIAPKLGAQFSDKFYEFMHSEHKTLAKGTKYTGISNI